MWRVVIYGYSRLACDHLFGKLLFTWLSLVMSMMVSFVLSFFPRDVLDEILNLIESVSEDFLTTLPKGTLNYSYGFIANTDIHSRVGQHWCAFYGDGDGHVEFFDSYGRSPNSNSVYFVRWLDTYVKSIEINDKQLQSDNSTLCGLYCILFLRQRFPGQTMQDIASMFDSTNACANDEYVYDFISNAYSCCVQSDDQICSWKCI